jgi:folate-dependent phosphoribosylglycinamide formyltransferase PurN
MDFSDWGNLRAIVEKFLSQIQQAKYNIVCISHEEEVELEDGRKKIVPVCGSSKSSRNTAKYFDHVLYTELKNKKHITASSTTYANNILTGSRTDVFMDADVNPTLLSIFKKEVQRPVTQGQTALSQLKGIAK